MIGCTLLESSVRSLAGGESSPTLEIGCLKSRCRDLHRGLRKLLLNWI